MICRYSGRQTEVERRAEADSKPERRLNVKTFIVSRRPIDRLSAWSSAHARTSGRFAVPLGRVVSGIRRLLAPIVVRGTAILAFLEAAPFAARAACPTNFHATPRALEVHVAGFAPRTLDPRGSYSPFALPVPPPSVAQMAPIDFITHPATGGPNHSRAEWAVSSAVPSRPPATAAPALAWRASLRRLQSFLCGTERLQGRRRSRGWTFRATLMLHAVMGAMVASRMFTQLHAVVWATVPGGTSLETSRRRRQLSRSDSAPELTRVIVSSRACARSFLALYDVILLAHFGAQVSTAPRTPPRRVSRLPLPEALKTYFVSPQLMLLSLIHI